MKNMNVGPQMPLQRYATLEYIFVTIVTKAASTAIVG